jgi:hypothetical protein
MRRIGKWFALESFSMQRRDGECDDRLADWIAPDRL